MSGRESKLENDLFFACSVIEHIGREMKIKRSDVVQILGEKDLGKLLELADVLHCEPIENTAADLIEEHGFLTGTFDNVIGCNYGVPTIFDIAKVYKRLIASVSENQNIPLLDALKEVYSSWISAKIDDYNSSMYFENPQYIYESYIAGEPLKE